MATQVCSYEQEDLSSTTDVSSIKSECQSPLPKPSNPFSIENLLKLEPTSPSTLPGDVEESDEKDNNNNQHNNSVDLTNNQAAMLFHQAQLQHYWGYMLLNNIIRQQRSAEQIKTVFVASPVQVAAGLKAQKAAINKRYPSKKKFQNLTSTFKAPESKGIKRHNIITPLTEKRIKLELDIEDANLHSQKESRNITRDEYEQKCSKALSLLHREFTSIPDASLTNKTFLEMVDINKVLNISAIDLNNIIDDVTYTDQERAYIRELRRKAMNKKAAEECRKRKKNEEHNLEEEFLTLNNQRRALMGQKQNLANEIADFKQSVGILPPE
ncbi:hypothetical protein LOD99_16234 [Oopsacas minuta]|uniref:BZIP domain-containing protein n=1 Tax=Oopsacas minuta TaxID=111878 RepID=A0AAV7K6G1_9METZ|nr:hypothetical protein LOD99_16234 [Oopsacas minuta]